MILLSPFEAHILVGAAAAAGCAGLAPTAPNMSANGLPVNCSRSSDALLAYAYQKFNLF